MQRTPLIARWAEATGGEPLPPSWKSYQQHNPEKAAQIARSHPDLVQAIGGSQTADHNRFIE